MISTIFKKLKKVEEEELEPKIKPVLEQSREDQNSL